MEFDYRKQYWTLKNLITKYDRERDEREERKRAKQELENNLIEKEQML